MSTGQILYLCMVLTGFLTFMGTLGFVSWWSRKPHEPQKQLEMASADKPPMATEQLRKAA